MIHRTLNILLCALLIAPSAFAQSLPAFPGAEGFGGYVTGGRSGQVIYVTNLNNSGPGSLNEALSAPGPRYILFKVSGVIDAAAEVLYGDFTLAGQTSPGGIITRGFIVDEDYDTVGTGDNIIVRHLRSRPHDPALYPSPNYILDDACRLDGASNVIIDHCSFANAIDECIQISESRNITIQNTSLAETIGDHFYLGGMLLNYSVPELPQDSISIHHNIWNRIGGRMPEFSCESPYGSHRHLNVELSSNLIWDQPINIWYNSSIDPGTPIDSFFLNLNWIDNMSYGRPTYGSGMIDHSFLNIAANNIYASGNKLNLYPSYSDYDLFYCCNDFPLTGNNPNTDPGVANLLGSRHPFPAITYTAAGGLKDYMLDNAGAFPRDSMDRRLFKPLIADVIDPTPVDETDHYNDGFITSAAPAPPADGDDDGMPDYWETAHGLNPAVQDHNGTGLSMSITGVDGYTNLECYLNCLSDLLVNGVSTSACNVMLAVADHYVPHARIWPNPATHVLNLELPYEGCTVSITNVCGQAMTVRSHCTKKETMQLNLPAGIYFCEISGAKGSEVQKLIIR